MPNGKLRLCVEKYGRTCELFSIEEKDDGDLYLFVKKTLPGIDSTYHTVEDRYSVHNSPDSIDGSFLIKHTSRKSTSETTESYMQVRPNGGSQMAHPFAVLLPEFGPEYDVKPKKGDRILVALDGIRDGTLFYIVLVNRNGLMKQDLEGSGLTIQPIKFDRFEIFVLIGMFQMTPTSQSISVYKTSLPSKINKIKEIMIKDPRVPEPVSPLSRHMPHLIDEMINDLVIFSSREIRKRMSNINGGEFSSNYVENYLGGFARYTNGPKYDVVTLREERHRYFVDNPADGLWVPVDEDTSFVKVMTPPKIT